MKAKTQGNNNKFINQTADEIFKELNEDYKSYIHNHPDPFEHHFGLGLYIRNHYIYNNSSNFGNEHPDNISSKILMRVIELVNDYYEKQRV